MNEEIGIGNFDDENALSGNTSGFPSPAGDYLSMGINLNRELIKHPAATFFGRAKVDSVDYFNISKDDLLIIDKSLQAKNNDVIVCYINGEFALRRICFEKKAIYLIDNQNKKTLFNDTESNIIIWGVVTYSIKKIN